jgi:ADP-dependent NAD(P)H-hydrate dehydratase / NAD(P)H-hydrate epimerase
VTPDACIELWNASTAALADRHTIEALGVPSVVLMERAALATSHEIVALRAGSTLPVVVVAGPGNNGGDGFAVARQLHGWGVPTLACAVGPTRNEACEQQLALARASGVTLVERIGELPRRAIVVDALLGTGSKGAPRGTIAEALAELDAIEGPRVAIDLPSGVDPDTGAVAEHAVRARVTVTFVRSKPGLHVTPGRAHAGVVVVADIGITSPPGTRPSALLLDPEAAHAELRARPPAAHKGERGHVGMVGLVAGARDTPGAALLAATAAFRAGAGLCTVATDDPVLRQDLLAARPELMFADASARPPAPSAKALVVGPGLTDRAAHAGLAWLWEHDERAAVWDASALESIPLGPPPKAARVITPHPGEAAKLLARGLDDDAWTSARVQAERLAAARTLASITAATVVLKGEGTIVAQPDGALAIVPIGGSGLATAGSGDVLAGVIAALLVRDETAARAATLGVLFHARAGDIASARHPGTLALDVVDALDDALAATPWPVHGLPRLRRA